MLAGYLPVVIPVELKKEYFEAMEEFKLNKNPEKFEHLIKQLENDQIRRLI